MVDVQYCYAVVNDFELLSIHYVYFRENNLGKGRDSVSPQLCDHMHIEFFYKNKFDIKLHKSWYAIK